MCLELKKFLKTNLMSEMFFAINFCVKDYHNLRIKIRMDTVRALNYVQRIRAL